MALLNFSGRLTLLRVHDRGTKFGPPTDQIDVEVVFKLNSHPDKAFGFTLRDDANGPAHRGMLDLLRSGFDHNWAGLDRRGDRYRQEERQEHPGMAVQVSDLATRCGFGVAHASGRPT